MNKKKFFTEIPVESGTGRTNRRLQRRELRFGTESMDCMDNAGLWMLLVEEGPRNLYQHIHAGLYAAFRPKEFWEVAARNGGTDGNGKEFCDIWVRYLGPELQHLKKTKKQRKRQARPAAVTADTGPAPGQDPLEYAFNNQRKLGR